MPKVQFYYFPVKALGEGIRMLLAYGGQEFEDVRIEDEEWEDFKHKVTQLHYEENEEVKAKKHELYSKEVYPAILDKLDEMLKKNNGYIAAGKLSWADFMFAGLYDYLKVMLRTPDLDETYPRFKKLQDTVVNLPKVKEFVASAPKCDI